MNTTSIRDIIMNPKEEESSTPIRFRTGCTLLDLAVGGASGVMGFPAGVIVNIIGDKSAGKSFLKNEIFARGYHDHKQRGYRWFSDDTETGDTFDTTNLYGFNIRPEARKLGTRSVEDSATVEELDAKVTKFLETIKEGECGIYAVDSLDGLSDANREAMQTARANQLANGVEVKDKGDYGMQIAKFLSQHFFKGQHQAIKHNNSLLMIISQIRDNPEAMMFGQKWEVSGGKAMEFYCHTRLFLTTIQKIERAGRVVGVYVEAKVLKSKTPRPFRKCRFTFYFDYGLDDIGSCLDYLYSLRDAKTGNIDAGSTKNIAWDGKCERNLENIRVWLKDVGLDEKARLDKKKDTGNANLSLDWFAKWVESDPAIQVQYRSHFGDVYDRETLIQKIEGDPALYQELQRRTIEKWEGEEAAASINRGRKYI